MHAARPAGSFGVAAAVSFNGNKIMTTSGGGMLLTDDASDRRARPISEHPGPAAGGALRAHRDRLQLPAEQRAGRPGRGPAGTARRDDRAPPRRSAPPYAELFAAVPGVRVFQRPGDEEDNCWLTAVLVDPAVTGWSAEDLRLALDQAGDRVPPAVEADAPPAGVRAARARLNGVADDLFALA